MTVYPNYRHGCECKGFTHYEDCTCHFGYSTRDFLEGLRTAAQSALDFDDIKRKKTTERIAFISKPSCFVICLLCNAKSLGLHFLQPGDALNLKCPGCEKRFPTLTRYVVMVDCGPNIGPQQFQRFEVCPVCSGLVPNAAAHAKTEHHLGVNILKPLDVDKCPLCAFRGKKMLRHLVNTHHVRGNQARQYLQQRRS
jgi:hypothetical protein